MLKILELSVCYRRDKEVIKAVDGVSLSMMGGETLGIVGESGSGKSTLALCIMGLLPKNAEIKGKVLFLEKDLLLLDESGMQKMRGREIGMIFQQPQQSLNPLFTIGEQLKDTLKVHYSLDKVEAERGARELLQRVQIKDVERILRSFPHQLSGGLAQRCMIALAISLKPSLLLADEPTSGLDVQTSEGILQLLAELVTEEGVSMMLITHQLDVAQRLCKRIAIFYAGRVLEYGEGEKVFSSPLHPYTEALIHSIPQRGKRLKVLEGEPPDMRSLPSGCKFHPRCPKRKEECTQTEPPLKKMEDGRLLRCFLP